MKRLGMIVMAGLLLLGLAQCKKEQTPAGTGTVGVRITLNVGPSAGSGTNGSRVVVDPTGNNGEFDYATVNYENGDIIYVGYNGACVGSLTCQDNTVSGEVNITETVEGEHLHFYLLGGKGFTPVIDETNNTATVNISEQATNYPVISYAPSKEAYNGAGSYTARLLNKCSIVKFNVTTPSTAAICITGMNNKVTVNFADPTAEDNGFSYDMDGDGLITMPGVTAENTTTWAIVLPQEALAAGEEGSAYTEGYTGTRPLIHAIESNKFYHEGDDVIALEVNTPAVPEGAIDGKFTINGDGDQVYFSKGNLQYIGSATTPYWKFADNQWDYLGTTTSQNSDEQNVDRDLFGWGTSGINDYTPIATCWQPWSTSTTNGHYNPYGCAFPYTNNLNSESGKADWGYNAISNGGNQAGDISGRIAWRTLTTDEWVYLFNTRQTGKTVNGTSNARYTEATINTDGSSVNGIILFPDGYSGPTSSTDGDGITFGAINNPSAWGTTCTSAGWQTLEAAGCVFLPTTGQRDGTSVHDAGAHGYYWSSTHHNPNTAYSLYFDSNFVYPQTDGIRRFGNSVRLACPAE